MCEKRLHADVNGSGGVKALFLDRWTGWHSVEPFLKMQVKKF